jgi:hypothetical protein
LGQNRHENEPFFENSSIKIWWIGEKRVPLHPLSQNHGLAEERYLTYFT